ncbi:hypothetical protein Ga0451573_003915, partial [Peptococcaceae bacterium DYL19]|nr:hypothetical protein [Phosphitispora fastidiosa]
AAQVYWSHEIGLVNGHHTGLPRAELSGEKPMEGPREIRDEL